MKKLKIVPEGYAGPGFFDLSSKLLLPRHTGLGRTRMVMICEVVVLKHIAAWPSAWAQMFLNSISHIMNYVFLPGGQLRERCGKTDRWSPMLLLQGGCRPQAGGCSAYALVLSSVEDRG